MYVIPELLRVVKAGRAYLGVGPEQNFTYIAALKPTIAFIVDIRRGNLNLHLLYKALFEVSADRADFVSRLFAKPRPAGLDAKSTAADIFDAYAGVAASERLYVETLATVRHQLVTKHGFALADEDLRAIEFVYRAFFMFGPDVRYSPVGVAGGTVQPTYAQLMIATDERGQARGFLSSEEAFTFVKALETRNLIVPVVGDFAGPKAVRSVGVYLKQKRAMVSVFYVSNVEEHLQRDGMWQDFCDNVSALPIDDSSSFVRSTRPPPASPLRRHDVGMGTDGPNQQLPVASTADCHHTNSPRRVKVGSKSSTALLASVRAYSATVFAGPVSVPSLGIFRRIRLIPASSRLAKSSTPSAPPTHSETARASTG